MKTAIEIINDLVNDVIRKRGYLYFLNGSVSDLEYSQLNASAVVTGSQKYYVKIAFDEQKYPVDLSCSCPFSDTGVCKHIIAVLYTLNEHRFFNGTENDYLGENVAVNNDKPKNSVLTPELRKKWLKEIEQKKEAAKFEEFNRKISVLIKKDEKKNTADNYRIVYSIQPKGYRTILHAVRQRLKKDGSVAASDIIHGDSFTNLPSLSLQEKLIIEHISKHFGEFAVELIASDDYVIKSKEHINGSSFFNELLSFLADKELFLFEDHLKLGKQIFIQKDEGKAKLFFDEDGANISLHLEFEFQNEKIKKAKEIIPVLDNPLWVLYGNKVFKISNLSYSQFYNFYRSSNMISIPKVYLEYFEQNLLPQLANNLPIESAKYIVSEISAPPVKRVYLDEAGADLRVVLKFGYGEYELSYDENETSSSLFKDNKILRILRDKITEEAALSEIKSFYVKEIEKGIFTPRNNPVNFLFDSLPLMKEMGFEIFGEANLSKFKVNTSTPRFSFSVTSGIDWFDVKADIIFNETSISFHSLQDAIKNKREYIQLKDGSVGILPKQWINKFKRAFSFGEIIRNKDGLDQVGIRFSRLQANAIDLLLKDVESNTDDEYKEHIERLNSFEKIRHQKVPAVFENVLRSYQKSGYDWLYFLKEFHFGGILADDMGLGKTIQVLALLQNEKENGKILPDLVIAPTSVIFNWVNESIKFSPELKILNHTGNNRIKEDTLHFENYDVIFTSYPILLRDIEQFTERKFNYLVLDESQKIKNPASQTAKIVRTLKAENRLCLTGTPVENNLNELWSQMAFLNPGLLGSLNKFQETFVKPIQKSNDDSASEYLRKTVYPFILRRKKEVVAKELPEKTEIIHYCEMETKQLNIYNMWKDSIRENIIKEIDQNGINKSGFKVMEGLLRLRQICNHPLLVKENYTGKSGKFEEFKDQLENVLEENHKVLVFSQFVSMLNIIKEYLDIKNIPYEYLTGSTQNREACVRNFQENENIKVFLISLKAGGFGLNLTAADYVFHYDPWWNPAVQDQATDRTHRIGQDKNVFVYKFITKDSVEEKILRLQDQKKELAENIITGESGILKNLTKEDVNILFE